MYVCIIFIFLCMIGFGYSNTQFSWLYSFILKISYLFAYYQKYLKNFSKQKYSWHYEKFSYFCFFILFILPLFRYTVYYFKKKFLTKHENTEFLPRIPVLRLFLISKRKSISEFEKVEIWKQVEFQNAAYSNVNVRNQHFT